MATTLARQQHGPLILTHASVVSHVRVLARGEPKGLVDRWETLKEGPKRGNTSAEDKCADLDFRPEK